MDAKSNLPRQPLTPAGAEVRLVEIEKCQQLAGHFPSASALDRAYRILIGELTPDDARAEILAKYAE
jgi:hypothetical protein